MARNASTQTPNPSVHFCADCAAEGRHSVPAATVFEDLPLCQKHLKVRRGGEGAQERKVTDKKRKYSPGLRRDVVALYEKGMTPLQIRDELAKKGRFDHYLSNPIIAIHGVIRAHKSRTSG